jgi:hypothetical protein
VNDFLSLEWDRPEIRLEAREIFRRKAGDELVVWPRALRRWAN